MRWDVPMIRNVRISLILGILRQGSSGTAWFCTGTICRNRIEAILSFPTPVLYFKGKDCK